MHPIVTIMIGALFGYVVIGGLVTKLFHVYPKVECVQVNEKAVDNIEH